MAVKRHGDKYDYSKVLEDYGTTEKVRITCKECGNEFSQKPSEHLRGTGCPYCHTFPTKDSIASIRDKIAAKFPTITLLSDKYVDNDSAIDVCCSKHGYQWSTTTHRLLSQTYGCKYCYEEHRLKEIRESRSEAFQAVLDKYYKDRYDISHAVYKNSSEKVMLVCPIHGEFYLTPNKIMSRKDGCPYCKESKLEKETSRILESLGVEYSRQQTFDWLVDKGKMSLDFFITQLNMAIECQGEQHLKENVGFFGTLDDRVKKDMLKNEQCSSHGIKIIYVANKKFVSDAQKIPLYKDGIETVETLKEKLANLSLG
jgi:glutaredoxin